MHWDFVDIGTSDFEYSTEGKVLLVEPINAYLQNIPNNDNITKANYAIGNVNRTVEIHYISPEIIDKKELPTWVRGCNSIGKRHNLTQYVIEEASLSDDAVQVDKVKMITFPDLCALYDISSIGVLKVDTEGNEIDILKSVLTANVTIDKLDIELHLDHYRLEEIESIVQQYTNYKAELIDKDPFRYLLTRVQ